MRKKTKLLFLNECFEKFGNRFDYTNVNYINNRTKVIIKCYIHGDFKQTPYKHINSNGCPKCSDRYRKTSYDFIKKSIDIHGELYDYSLVEYFNNRTNVIIICNKHGKFQQLPLNHIRGRGCKRCANNVLKTNEDFIRESREVHGELYDYSLVEYKGRYDKVVIICKKHGKFEQVPNNHINNNRGCGKCSLSKGEVLIMNFLESVNIDYESQKEFNGCENKLKLKFDFYLPNYNILIEYDGEQHFYPIEFFGGDSSYEETKFRDEIKNEWVKSSDNILLRVNYKMSRSEIESKIEKIIDKYEKN